MEFFTVSKTKRPVRSCEATRQFAWDSLNHKYGIDTYNTPAVTLDDVEGFASLDGYKQYDAAIRRIAERAPIRICEGERLSGAATLGLAIDHQVPATFGGKVVSYGISHVTVDFETVLKHGMNAIGEEIDAALLVHTSSRRKLHTESFKSAYESMKIWHARYLEALADKPGYEENYNNLLRVPFGPAGNFYEAVQSVWFCFAFLRLCGVWTGFGRLDYLLGDYLKRDLEDGTVTLDEAREILAHFFIKGCEWIKGGEYYGGDAQHYQNIVLGGTDGDGSDVTNEVSYLVLDIIEEFGISDFPTTVRLNKNTDHEFLHRACEVVRFGGGVIAFYNEELIMKALVGYGYPEDEVWRFANDGCWEVQIPGRTNFSYNALDTLQILQHVTLDDYSGKVTFDTFEALYEKYLADLRVGIGDMCQAYLRQIADTSVPADEQTWKYNIPCGVISIFERSCIAKGMAYTEGGCDYDVRSPHLGGLPDTVNSLYAIKKLVFDEKKVTLGELCDILGNNWEGAEPLRRYASSAYAYYGNDNDECDEIAAKIVEYSAGVCAEYDGLSPIKFPLGISTFGRQLGWAHDRLASPSGHKAGDVLAPNYSPTPGSDAAGATAIVRSYCKTDLTKTVCGAALDVKLLPSSVEGDDGLCALEALLRGFVTLGGFFIQPDVEDREILKDAKAHPENYPTLSVRVSGWNARFVTLSPDWQDMIIDANK